QLARDKLTDEQKKTLALEGRTNLTPEQQAALDVAKNAYIANKAAVTPQVMSLFHREILPVTNFIADRANFYSVKPLVLFDAGRVILPGARDDGTRFGVGGGLQLDIVLARFELGYVAAVNRIPGDGRGSIFVRLIIKRFF